jgi:hypothetical protein
MNDVVTALISLASKPTLPNKHDETLRLLCNLCIERLGHFDGFAKSIVRLLVNQLPNVCDDHVMKLFATAFIAAAGLEDDVAKTGVLCQ